jgi:arylsulfatase A-like enzyme
VTLADVMPTVLGITGTDAAGIQMDGCDMLELAKAAPKEDRVFYGNYGDSHLAVIKDNVKYTLARHGSGELMFDLTDDPMERRNLMQAQPGLAGEMRALLTDKVKGYKPELVEDGKITALQTITSPNDVPKWPGFHSTLYPCDVLH